MPRIRRYFPVSHDVNEDPILWEMTRRFGDRTLRVWLELESIADRNGGYLPTLSHGNDDPSTTLCHAIAKALAGRCQLSRVTVTKVWDYLVNASSIVCDPVPRLSNFSDFHKTRDTNEIPPGKNTGSSLPNQPNLPNQPFLKDRERAPSAAVDKPKKEGKKLNPQIEAAADRLYRSDPQRFQKLVQWIKQKQNQGYHDSDIAKSLEAVEDREKKYGSVNDWWGYLEGENGTGQSMLERFRTKRLQHESERHKKADGVWLGEIAELEKLAASEKKER